MGTLEDFNFEEIQEEEETHISPEIPVEDEESEPEEELVNNTSHRPKWMFANDKALAFISEVDVLDPHEITDDHIKTIIGVRGEGGLIRELINAMPTDTVDRHPVESVRGEMMFPGDGQDTPQWRRNVFLFYSHTDTVSDLWQLVFTRAGISNKEMPGMNRAIRTVIREIRYAKVSDEEGAARKYTFVQAMEKMRTVKEFIDDNGNSFVLKNGMTIEHFYQLRLAFDFRNVRAKLEEKLKKEEKLAKTRKEARDQSLEKLSVAKEAGSRIGREVGRLFGFFKDVKVGINKGLRGDIDDN